MKFLHVVISSAALILLAGCSDIGLSSKRIDYKAGAVQAPSLEIPPDLTTPTREERYKVPRGGDETVATYSDYSKGAAAAAQKQEVLPVVKGVRLERSGTQRWLVVEDKPENVWNVVKTFWQENGLTIKTEDQAAGVMETDWIENRAKIPQDGIRNLLGKVFDGMYSSNERDQYRTRMERSKDGVSIEIFITHRGKEEMVDADKNAYRWQSRPNDPELEAIMLQKLMARFGVSEEQAANALASDAGVPDPVAPSSLQTAANGGNIIVVSDTFDKSWRRVGLAVERAGLAIEDKDRIRGIYFLRTQTKEESGWMDKLQFWKSGKDANSYRVIVKDKVSSSEVTVTDQNGASDDTSRQMIEAIYKNIKQ